MRNKTYNVSLRSTTPVIIHLYQSVETPLGRFSWDPVKVGLGLFVAVLAGTASLFGGTLLGNLAGGPLFASFSGMASSVLGSTLCFLATIKG